MAKISILSFILIFNIVENNYAQVNRLRSDFFYSDSSEYYSRWLFPDWYLLYKQYGKKVSNFAINDSFQFYNILDSTPIDFYVDSIILDSKSRILLTINKHYDEFKVLNYRSLTSYSYTSDSLTKFIIIENDTNILNGFEYIQMNKEIDYLLNKNLDTLTKDEFVLNNGQIQNYKNYYYWKEDKKFHIVSNYEYSYSGNKLQSVHRSFFDHEGTFIGAFLDSSFYNNQGELVYEKYHTLDTLTNTYVFDGFLNVYGSKLPSDLKNPPTDQGVKLIFSDPIKILWHPSILCCSNGQLIILSLDGKICDIIPVGQLQTEKEWPSHLSVGAYIVQIRTNDRIYSSKLIKLNH